MKRKIGIVFMAVSVMFSVTFCSRQSASSASGGPVHLKMATVLSESTEFAGERFKKLVEEYTNGTVVVDHFPRNQLGNDLPVVESTIVGDIDIAVSSTSSVCELYRDLYIFDAPFMFLDVQDAYRRLDSATGKKILDGMTVKGLKGMAFWENGFRNFTNNKVAVRLPSDVKGMKIRTMNNDIHLAAWKAFGANPTPMAFSELYTAMQQGTVDGQENPLGIIDTNNFQSVQKFISLTQHVYTPYLVVMNLKKYQSLTEAQQNAVDRAMAESTPYQREKSQEQEEATLVKFGKEGVTAITLTAEEKAAWQKLVKDNNIFDLVRGKMDHPELMDEMLK